MWSFISKEFWNDYSDEIRICSTLSYVPCDFKKSNICSFSSLAYIFVLFKCCSNIECLFKGIILFKMFLKKEYKNDFNEKK